MCTGSIRAPAQPVHSARRAGVAGAPNCVHLGDEVTASGFPDRTFEAIVFDWDGTAVPDRSADAGDVRERVEALTAAGVDVTVVSGTHIGNIDCQLDARPRGSGRLFLCLNRGSEVFEITERGPVLRWRRVATPREEQLLDRAADAIRDELRSRGLDVEIVSERLNRRKIDLIPDPDWSDPPKARIAELLEAVTGRLEARGMTGLSEVVVRAEEIARAEGLDDPRVTTDAKHVEVGLTDKADSIRWVLSELAVRGVGPGLVLVVGDEFGSLGGVPGSDAQMLVPEVARAFVVSVGAEPAAVPFGVRHLPGGPDRFVALLDDQLERRYRGRVPAIDEDPRWIIEFVDGAREQLRVREALTTIANGSFGTRGALEEDGPGTSPLVVAAGVYEDDGAHPPSLLRGPEWAVVDVQTRGEGRRILDLRTGVLWREAPTPSGTLRAARFAAVGPLGVAAMRVEAPAEDLTPGDPLAVPWGGHARFGVTRVESNRGGGITVAVAQETHRSHDLRTFERLVALDADPSRHPPRSRARSMAHRAHQAGFDRQLARHRSSWAEQWGDAHVAIEGDEASERAVRFALFHLISSVRNEGEAPLGARGLSGPAYDGHVFWDADVYALPVLAAVAPKRARAMLEYRIRRLPAARAIARERGLCGARFPWESADDGSEVTPAVVPDGRGDHVRVHTGGHADHISSDVAWAAVRYARWTGDDAFLTAAGRPLLEDVARFWTSRLRVGSDGRAHIYGVVGPDEYHGIVDDNAFTNVMARWVLRRAADNHVRPDAGEACEWRELADALVDGYDPASGLFEQFAGFFDLEPLLISEMADVPVAADLLLGRERVAGAQVIKQPDVLMLHFLVPNEVAPTSLEHNLDFYGPRTAHGSSLSPAVHAALLARAGRSREALALFRLAGRLDLDDLTGTTAGGLHIATMGGLWQALVHGFLGVDVEGDELVAEPNLPAEWKRVDVTFRFRGRRVRVSATADGAEIETEPHDESENPAGVSGSPIAGGDR